MIGLAILSALAGALITAVGFMGFSEIKKIHRFEQKQIRRRYIDAEKTQNCYDWLLPPEK